MYWGRWGHYKLSFSRDRNTTQEESHSQIHRVLFFPLTVLLQTSEFRAVDDDTHRPAGPLLPLSSSRHHPSIWFDRSFVAKHISIASSSSMASPNRHWPSMFRSNLACNIQQQQQPDMNGNGSSSSSFLLSPPTAATTGNGKPSLLSSGSTCMSLFSSCLG